MTYTSINTIKPFDIKKKTLKKFMQIGFSSLVMLWLSFSLNFPNIKKKKKKKNLLILMSFFIVPLPEWTW